SVILQASALSLADASVINSSLISFAAEISGPDGKDTVNLVPDEYNVFNVTYTPLSIGEYSVKFKAVYNNDTSSVKMDFSVKSYDMFMFPISKDKGASDGFSPGDTGYLILSGKDLSTSDKLDISSLTGGCDNSSINITSIKNSDGVAQGINVIDVYTLNDFSTDASLPPFVKDDITREMGAGLCAVKFVAPSTNDVYNIEVTADLNGSSENAYSMISVQEIFMWAYPVGSNGMWTDAFTPGSRVYMAIDAYDPKGRNVTINNVDLVEVYSEGNGIVTDKMLDEQFDSDDADWLTTFSFIANDSNVGHHFVKFRVNITLDKGGAEPLEVLAMGEGFFREETFKVWAYP
ncbi:MAG: hypothetical protein KAJ47_04405, partial [Candidatus Aenigmarchaeota archaeon]|nr:hypothetical protein [Candidatus Aenigmarchaeota archaeon]